MSKRGRFGNFPYDPELTDDEVRQVDLAVPGQPGPFGLGEPLNLQASFLLRKRLNLLTTQVHSLNQSTKRLEIATWLLLATTVLLLLAAILQYKR